MLARIKQFGLLEGVDYRICYQSTGGKPRTVYFVTAAVENLLRVSTRVKVYTNKETDNALNTVLVAPKAYPTEYPGQWVEDAPVVQTPVVARPQAAATAKSTLKIGDIEIKQDAEGRYCLNDLHRAAGGEARHKPANWLQNIQTKELITESEAASGIPAAHVVNGIGTYVCEDLVYDYAMWISAAFKLKVIQAYRTLQTQGVAVAGHSAEDFLQNPIKYMRTLMDQAERVLEEVAPKVEAFECLLESDGLFNRRQASTVLGLNQHAFNQWLARIISAQSLAHSK